MKKVISLSVIVLAGLSLAGCTPKRQEAPGNPHSKVEQMRYVKRVKQGKKGQEKIGKNKKAVRNKDNTNNQILKPWTYQKGKKVFKMVQLDQEGRARGSHIQLKESQVPKVKRSPYLTIRPSGWHNYKSYVNGKTAWIFNRGHLVGYQFCGIDQAPGNMITETAYLNQGGLTGMNDHNPNGMLYYENGLRKWLKIHPNDSLDYIVEPLYSKKDLVAKQVKLTYTGYDQQGRRIDINLNSQKEKQRGQVSYVILNNSTPLAKINYQTGASIVNKMYMHK